jgi:hypothetical protein
MATVTTVGSVSDGSRTTVADLVGNPLMIPARIIELLDNAFLTDVVFRDAGGNSNGLVGFEENTPLFLAGDVEDVAEYGEIPIAVGQRGIARVAVGVKRGLGVRVSREMRDENQIDKVNLQIRQLVNTMVRSEERVLRSLLLASSSIPSIAATAAWTGGTSKVRRDIANASEKIGTAKPAAEVSTEEYLGFEPDTIILPQSIKAVLQDNAEFLAVYNTTPEGAALQFRGAMPGQVLGLDPLLTRFWPNDRALVIQRGIVGFRSDTRPLEATGLYGEGGGPNGGPTESWRTDTTRKRVLGVDQPLAACWITGIQAA